MLTIFGLVFLCGAACGSALTRGYLHSRMLHSPMEAAYVLESARRVGLDHLRKDLSLTEIQERTVAKVLDDYGKFYQNIEDEREDVAEYGKRRILDTLSPDQRRRFEAIFGRNATAAALPH